MARVSISALLCFMLCISASAYAVETKIQLQGLSGELEKNVEINLAMIPTNQRMTLSLRNETEKAVREGLQALGYYHPIIKLTYEPEAPPKPATLTIDVAPGEGVIVENINLKIEGDAATDPDYQKLEEKAHTYVGKVLNHGNYDSLKESLQSLAWSKGYFDAHFNKNSLEVDPQTLKSYWNIDFSSGKRYKFGYVKFTGSQIREDYLQNLLPFKPGDFYSTTKLAELNQRLASTGWFNSALVTPEFDHVTANYQLPLFGELIPRSKNLLETKIGYSTDVGPRVGLGWKKPWINDRGHSLDTSIELSIPEPQITFEYQVPLLESPLEQYYLFQGGFLHQNLNNTIGNSSTLSMARYWNFSSGWQRSINLRWSYDDFTQAGIKTNTMLIYPGINVSRTRQRGGLMPTWGDTQNYSVDVSDRSWGSGADFIIFQAQNVWIRTLGKKNRFVIRGNVGWLDSDDFTKVPPTLRFFAGGDRSIRGYKYQSISPIDPTNNQLLGASRLLTGSLEYQYNVTGNWWSAIFVDSGEAVNSFKNSDFKTGAGIGVRWASPVGPVRFDIATPVDDSQNHDVQFYFSLGPEL